MPTPEAILRTYFRSKDENRPHLLEEVFSSVATLEVHNSSEAIAFPALTVGREAIADVLVRRFAQAYENVYSFYMAKPPADASAFSCDWLACMTDKDSRSVRVGCGRYDWVFEPTSPQLANRLVITIKVMQVLPPQQREPIFSWLRDLNYPWSTAAAVNALAPRIERLTPVLQYLGRADNDLRSPLPGRR